MIAEIRQRAYCIIFKSRYEVMSTYVGRVRAGQERHERREVLVIRQSQEFVDQQSCKDNENALKYVLKDGCGKLDTAILV